MPPKTLMTDWEVTRSIRDSYGQDCLPTSHFVDVLGNCNCGTFVQHKYSWQKMVEHLLTFMPKEEEDDKNNEASD